MRSLTSTGAKFLLAPFLSEKVNSNNLCLFSVEKIRFTRKNSRSEKQALGKEVENV